LENPFPSDSAASVLSVVRNPEIMGLPTRSVLQEDAERFPADDLLTAIRGLGRHEHRHRRRGAEAGGALRIRTGPGTAVRRPPGYATGSGLLLGADSARLGANKSARPMPELPIA
jgi:hypothetical protein